MRSRGKIILSSLYLIQDFEFTNLSSKLFKGTNFNLFMSTLPQTDHTLYNYTTELNFPKSIISFEVWEEKEKNPMLLFYTKITLFQLWWKFSRHPLEGESSLRLKFQSSYNFGIRLFSKKVVLIRPIFYC